MKEKVNEIINKLENSEEIVKLKELQNKINNNKTYLDLMNEFSQNQNDYILNNTYSEKVIDLRKKLFSIDEFNEYVKLQSNLRLLSIKINNIILSTIDNNIKCR